MRLMTAFVVVLAAACTTGPSVPKLRIYTSFDPNEAKIYVAAFEKEAGVSVEWVRLSAGEALARISAEAVNPQVSLWYGGPAPEFVAAKKAGLLTPYRPRTDFDLDARYHDPEWHWTGFYFGGLGFATNRKFLDEKGMEPPRSWADLLQPAFKGKVSMAYPYTSGTAYIALATLVQMMGEDKAFDYMGRLDGQIHHYNKSGSACVTQVGLGEVAACIAFSHDVLMKGKGRGYPVVLSFPEEGTGYEIGALALIKGGGQPELARKFADWALSRPAQSLMKEWFRVPLHPRADVSAGALPPGKLQLFDLNLERAGEDKPRLLERWRRGVART